MEETLDWGNTMLIPGIMKNSLAVIFKDMWYVFLQCVQLYVSGKDWKMRQVGCKQIHTGFAKRAEKMSESQGS